MITNPTNPPTCTNPRPRSAPTRCTSAHPVWCDLTRCTADSASQAAGYRPDVGGEHRSASISLNLTSAVWLPSRDGTAWLSQACAPWECAIYLHARAGGAELSMAVDYAGPVLDAVSRLLASAATPDVIAEVAAGEVTR
jgi:hypothetical protein